MSSQTPLSSLKEWAPFHIDALGLVTLLGAEEVDHYYGQLTENPWVDWLPQLGSQVVAGLRFSKPIPGFQLFNVNDGILTTEISPWLARWLLAQEFNESISIVTWRCQGTILKQKRLLLGWLGFLFGAAVDLAMIVLPILQEDWWGLANSIGLVFGVLVRQSLLAITKQELKESVGMAMGRGENEAERAKELVDIENHRRDHGKQMAPNVKISSDDSEDPREAHEVEIFTILPSGQSVTLRVPRSLLMTGILRNKDHSRLQGRARIRFLKRSGWFSLGVLLVSIGQAALMTQIVSVAVMIISTIIAIHKTGCDDTLIAGCLKAERDHQDETLLIKFFETDQERDDASVRPALKPGKGGRRMHAYARLRAARDVEGEGHESLEEWDLFPHKHNQRSKNEWMEEYSIAKREVNVYYPKWKASQAARKTSSWREHISTWV